MDKEKVLSDFGKRIRLNRILNRPGRGSSIVAFDHALVLGPIPGTEDPFRQISRFVAARANAILLNLGLIKRCIDCFPQAATPGVWPHGFVTAHCDIDALLQHWTNEYACLGYGEELYPALADFCELTGIEPILL